MGTLEFFRDLGRLLVAVLSGVNDQVHHAWVLVDRSGGVRLLLFVWPEVAKVLGNLIGLKAWTNSSLDVRSS